MSVENEDKVSTSFAEKVPTPVPVEKADDDDPRMGLPASVRVEEASTPMHLEPPTPDASGPWIKYTGIATVRTINANGWREAGVDSTKKAQWNYLNHMRLPKSMFNEEELNYLLNVDGRFSLVED